MSILIWIIGCVLIGMATAILIENPIISLPLAALLGFLFTQAWGPFQ